MCPTLTRPAGRWLGGFWPVCEGGTGAAFTVENRDRAVAVQLAARVGLRVGRGYHRPAPHNLDADLSLVMAAGPARRVFTMPTGQ